MKNLFIMIPCLGNSLNQCPGNIYQLSVQESLSQVDGGSSS